MQVPWMPEIVQQMVWTQEMVQVFAPKCINSDALAKCGSGGGPGIVLFCASVNSLNLIYSLKALSRSKLLSEVTIICQVSKSQTTTLWRRLIK